MNLTCGENQSPAPRQINNLYIFSTDSVIFLNLILMLIENYISENFFFCMSRHNYYMLLNEFKFYAETSYSLIFIPSCFYIETSKLIIADCLFWINEKFYVFTRCFFLPFRKWLLLSEYRYLRYTYICINIIPIYKIMNTHKNNTRKREKHTHPKLSQLQHGLE